MAARKGGKKPTAKRKSKEKPSIKAKAVAPVVVEKKPQGGQSVYVRAIADDICERMANGETLNQICRTPGYPSRPTVINWYLDDRDGFADRYARAREALHDFWEDETIEIADDGTNDYVERESAKGETRIALDKEHVDRSKLRVETRKWMLTKLRPQKFGDKIEQKHTGMEAFAAIWSQMGGGKDKSRP